MVVYAENGIYKKSTTTKTVQIGDTSSKLKRTTIQTQYTKTLTTNTTVKITVTALDNTKPTGKVSILNSSGKILATKTLDNNGQATITVKLTAGNQKLTAKYFGNNVYNQSNITKTVKIIKVNTKMTVLILKQTVINSTLSVTVKDANNQLVKKGTVNVLNSKGKVIAKSNLSNGKSTIKLNLLSGTQKLTIKYLSNDMYNPSTSTKTLNVVKEGTKVTVQTLEANMDNVLLYVSVKDSSKNLIQSGNVQILNSKNKVIARGTLSYGEAYVSLTPVEGYQKYTIKYLGNNKYKASTTTKAVKIIRESTSISVNPIKATTKNTELCIYVKDSNGNSVDSGTVQVLNSNGKIIASGTLSYGEVYLSFTPSKGYQKFTIKYLGNNDYRPSSVTKTYYIKDTTPTTKNYGTTTCKIRSSGSMSIASSNSRVYTDNKGWTYQKTRYIITGGGLLKKYGVTIKYTYSLSEAKKIIRSCNSVGYASIHAYEKYYKKTTTQTYTSGKTKTTYTATWNCYDYYSINDPEYLYITSGGTVKYNTKVTTYYE